MTTVGFAQSIERKERARFRRILENGLGELWSGLDLATGDRNAANLIDEVFSDMRMKITPRKRKESKNG